MWNVPEPKGITRTTPFEAEKLKLVSEGCDPKSVRIFKAVFVTCRNGYMSKKVITLLLLFFLFVNFFDLFIFFSWMRRK